MKTSMPECTREELYGIFTTHSLGELIVELAQMCNKYDEEHDFTYDEKNPAVDLQWFKQVRESLDLLKKKIGHNIDYPHNRQFSLGDPRT